MKELNDGWKKYDKCREYSIHEKCKSLLPKWFDKSFPTVFNS
ncbi:hypothetical protein OVS_03190 [Mycoplasma ovis str. Michigan]|uniref:Transposase n=1 Tax=Mycoplasma ovis str. Michigan TaxID=1415773 RepID=A0ABM5P1R7_9MOLU|nr:hypothetical protein [Mycoplasma ovis]AHC40391.1 hypothetical protein OVS_03190 [Mycoplasma ovis str. Michigan]